MSTLELVPVVRPNGKVYLPKRHPWVIGATDDDEVHWVYVLRTHDVDLARKLARPFVCSHIVDPQMLWVRETIRRGEPFLAHGEERRGMPAVRFRESDEPEKVQSDPASDY